MNYFKQVRNLIKQEKLFSFIYIIGTGLSITMVMTLSIVYYIKIGNIYPETNRDRLLVTIIGIEKREGSMYAGQLSYHVIETCLKSLKTAQAVTAVTGGYGN